MEGGITTQLLKCLMEFVHTNVRMCYSIFAHPTLTWLPVP